MDKDGIFTISNGKMVIKWHTLFREEKNPLLRNYNKQLPYFLVTNCDIAESIHEYGQESINKLQQHNMHMYIYDTLIPNMS